MNQPMPPQFQNVPPSGGFRQPPYNPNPYQAPEHKKPIYKKWWFWLIVVIVIVAIGGGAAGAGGGKSEPAPVQDARPRLRKVTTPSPMRLSSTTDTDRIR